MRGIRLFLTAFLIWSGTALPSAQAEGDAGKKPAPTLILDISGRLINAAMRKPVDRTEPFTDVIEDTPVAGTQQTVGTLHVELVPDPCAGVVEVVLGGRVSSCEVGTRHHVRIYTRTFSPFEVRQRIILTPQSIRSVPGSRWANATITLLEATNRDNDPEALSAMLARHGFRDSKDVMQNIVSRKTAAKAGQGLEDDLAAPLTEASGKVGFAMKKLKALGLTGTALSFETTSTYLTGRFAADTPGYPRPVAPPEVLPGDDLIVRVHESLLNHTASLALGGKTFGLSELQERIDELTGAFLRDGRDDKERNALLRTVDKLLKGFTGKAPKFTLAQVNPVVVSFNEGGFTIEVNIASIDLDGKEFRGIRVEADYRIENKAGQVLALRDGPARVSSEEKKDPKKKTLMEKAERFVLETVAAGAFKSRLTLADLPPPEVQGFPMLRPARAEAGAGWLMLAWKLPSKKD